MKTLLHHIKASEFFTAGQIELLEQAGVPEIDPGFWDNTVKNIVQYYSVDPGEMDSELYKYAQRLLTEGNVDSAWQVLLTTATG